MASFDASDFDLKPHRCFRGFQAEVIEASSVCETDMWMLLPRIPAGTKLPLEYIFAGGNLVTMALYIHTYMYIHIGRLGENCPQ